jgi:hypothetical protein
MFVISVPGAVVRASRVLPNVNPILGQINKVIQFVKVESAE